MNAVFLLMLFSKGTFQIWKKMLKGPLNEMHSLTVQMFISMHASYKSKLMRMVMVRAQSLLVNSKTRKIRNVLFFGGYEF